jgi:hypothetical protein
MAISVIPRPQSDLLSHELKQAYVPVTPGTYISEELRSKFRLGHRLFSKYFSVFRCSREGRQEDLGSIT